MKMKIWSVVKILSDHGERIGIEEQPVSPDYCYQQGLTEDGADKCCSKLSQELNIPVFNNDEDTFIDYLEVKEG
jgi:hypothetical protein